MSGDTSPGSGPIAEVIARWQEQLLQLDRRNNLLYFRAGRPAVSLTGVASADVDAWLDGPSAAWRFPYAERVRRDREDGAGEDDGDVRVTDGDIETDAEPLELQRRLAALHRREREWEEEQGLNVLFLAVGFLRWRDAGGEEARSPIALLPCDLERPSPRDPFLLRPEDDQAEVNATLAHHLRTLGAELPELREDQPIAAYLGEVREAIRGKPDWEVEEGVALGVFAFSKLAMYEDLDRMRRKGVEHPLVRRLARGAGEGGAQGAPMPSALPPDGELAGGGLDDLLELRDQFTVMDADFSQLRAIETARGGGHLVIHGPPGTGKSQTIANLIATLLADGKRVLFVSEKSAALDVVKRRLEQCDLGVFCLDLHSERARKSSVYEQLRASVEDARSVPRDALPFEDLRDRRVRLNAFVRALHQPREPLGLTAYEAQGRYAGVQGLPNVDFDAGDAGTLDMARLVRIEGIAERIARRPDEFREHRASRWTPLRTERPSLGLPDRIREALERATAAAGEAEGRAAPIAEWTGVHAPSTAGDCEAAAALLGHLSHGGGVPPHWLDADVLARLGRLAEEQERQQAQRRELEAEARRAFGGARPAAGYREAAEALRRVEAEAPAVAALAGGGWARWIVANPAQRPERLGEAAEAAGAAEAAAARLAELLGGADAASAADLAAAAEWAERLLRLYPAPGPWLDPEAEQDARRDFASLTEWLDLLCKAEARLRAGFDEDLPERVDREMRDRYRTDYRSWWRRLGGGWRRDQRLLHAALKAPRKLTPGESRDAVEQAYEVRWRREDWRERAPGYRERLGARFREWDTADPEAVRRDVEQLGRDMEETIAARREWPAGAGVLRGLLTEAGRRDALRSALGAARSALERFEAAAAALALPEPIGGDAPLAGVAARARGAVPPLRALLAAAGDVLAGLREPPDDFHALARLAGDMARLDAIEREDAQAAAALARDFGGRFAGADTDWPAIAGAIEWTRRALELAPARLSQRLAGHAAAPAAREEYEARAAELRAAAAAFAETIGAALDGDFGAERTQWGAWSAAPFAELRRWAGDLAEHAPSASGWVEYRAAVRDLEGELGEGAADRIREATAEAADAPGIVRRRILRAWLDGVHAASPALGGFSATDHARIREEFRELDRAQIASARARVRELCFERYPGQFETATGAGQISVLKAQLSKSRGQLSVRRLFRRAPLIMQALKPVMLMSPLAVSQYLAAGELASEAIEFDTVIFDEASQIFPEDAVPALARAKQAIVAGDRKQLPPTGFFRRTRDDDGADDEDDPDALAGRESILDALVGMAGDGVAEQYLSMHYRSRHEDLIRYSNRHFYDDRLLVFPSADREPRDLGVRSVYVPEGVYDMGGARTNRAEAERVADEVFRLLRERPERESVGVVALSRSQADLIEQLVEQRRLTERDLDARFAEERSERFFVKNLENVQGDERDHIVLSVGYGPTADGVTPQRFGPINAEGGERRLNVAVSRARRGMTVVHSLRASDIAGDSRNPGPRLLRRYLEYAGNPAAADRRRAVADPDADPESPFEEAVRRALEERGHRVASQVGVSGYRIDLAIQSEDGTAFDLGVECDGATYHSAPAARDRDRLRQDVLEGLGWRIHRVWSASWVRDAGAQLGAIERALAEARTERRAAAPGEAPRDGGDAGARTGEPPPGTPAPPEPPPSPPAQGSAAFFDEYAEASLADIAVGPEPGFETEERLTALVRRVASFEGPVHVDLVVERIRDRYGLGRAGSRIQERIEQGVRAAIRSGGVVRDGQFAEARFIRLPGGDAVPRRPPPDAPARRIEHVADSEIAAGILLTVQRLYGAGRDDLITETARQFGYGRTGPVIRERIGRVADALLREGRLRPSGDGLAASGPA